MSVEFDIITGCVIILTVHFITKDYGRRMLNWVERRRIHKQHLDSL